MPASSVSVTFPSLRQREARRPTRVEVIQQEWRHDIAVYSLPGGQVTARQYRAGTPVRIDWAVDREAASFCGYVHHVEQTRDGFSVWCSAASTVFDDGLRTSWDRRTFPSVAADLARHSGFDVEIVGHARQFSRITANGRAWDMLVEYAKEIGFSLYAKNTRLYLHPRTQMTSRYLSQAPVLRKTGPGTTPTLIDFHPMDGIAVPGERLTNHLVQGIDPRNGMAYSVRGGPARAKLGRQQYRPTQTRVHDIGTTYPSEARWKVAALAELDRYNVRATAVAEGSPRVHQTWPVIIAGVATPYIGGWFVHKVTHRIDVVNYTMELELGRDGTGSTVAIPTGRPTRVIATRSTPQGRPKSAYPPSTLAGVQWRSQWSSASRSF